MQKLMHGFPPDAAGQVTLANWRAAPFNRWAFQHVRELIPSADIANDRRNVWELPREPLALPLGDLLEQTDTDAIVVLHRGRIVFEHYANGMSGESPHILMSVSKSMLGLLAGILSGRGLLVEREASDFVPELKATGYRDVTLRQLLDMRAGIAFDEDYLASSGPIVEYRRATGWNPLGPADTLSDLRSFYRNLQEKEAAYDGRFHYVSPNTDLLGWVIERASGTRYADLMSELLWKPLGAERSAYITVDRLGAPRCAGGLCTTTRDLARVGQLVLEGGRGVVPESWIADIVGNGDPRAWDAGPFAPYFPGLEMHYRSKWYVARGAAPLVFGVGIHGQNLFVDRAAGIVIAKFSSQAAPMDGPRIAAAMKLVSTVREFVRKEAT